MNDHALHSVRENSAADNDGVRRLAVIGLGYIGLPTAATFASTGKQVVGIDISQRAVDAVNAGQTHIEEDGLPELVAQCVRNGNLRATTTPEPADDFIIAVPTPVDHDTHAPDVSYVEAAGRSIAPVLRAGNLVVLESTSPVGTTQMLARLLANLRPDLRFPLDGEEHPDVHLAYCPERIIPGRMLSELVENDRIIGGMSAACTQRATELYQCFVKGACLPGDDRTAELCKLTENAFRDVNIAFANELSMICGDIGLDVWKVIELANHHPRVNILNPGPGVGGHCIAVDPWFIVASAPERAHLVRTARQVNDSKPNYVLEQVAHAVAAAGQPTPRIACFGLTYKPDVDDFRESPALHIAHTLAKRYPGKLACVDPFHDALKFSGESTEGIVFESADDALRDAGVVVMLVGHSEFRSLPRPTGKAIIDATGFWKHSAP
ncbi:UDP-N-acetyl-D-mannosamine dehydrogenase [Lysobacter solisilvae (ex Woo and Kim 2020)]|uniref:UDP-N-acetyl-D-mannosamine dehydrogenase n=1 Tax=Agrilutibacter terrestris TaxID=2865112 RepID=A0A7H0FZG7_9GAMM|nr:UDP-N-acetyl-D-mannosamine dehydrogenase [Lysobacter terrestris]QNP41433.1 UDP-N-acetyl-D-mannosamine dehydrogenase [Lysobacter terrestris]